MIWVSATCHNPWDNWLINCPYHKNYVIVHFTIGGSNGSRGKWWQPVMPLVSQRCHCNLKTQSPVRALETVGLSLEDYLLKEQNIVTKIQPSTSRIIGFLHLSGIKMKFLHKSMLSCFLVISTALCSSIKLMCSYCRKFRKYNIIERKWKLCTTTQNKTTTANTMKVSLSLNAITALPSSWHVTPKKQTQVVTVTTPSFVAYYFKVEIIIHKSLCLLSPLKFSVEIF